MKGLGKTIRRLGYGRSWIDAGRIAGKELTWFDLPEKIRKKTLIAKSYPGLLASMTPTKCRAPSLTNKERRITRSVNYILKRKLGIDMDRDLTLKDRVEALVLSARWEIK